MSSTNISFLRLLLTLEEVSFTHFPVVVFSSEIWDANRRCWREADCSWWPDCPKCPDRCVLCKDCLCRSVPGAWKEPQNANPSGVPSADPPPADGGVAVNMSFFCFFRWEKLLDTFSNVLVSQHSFAVLFLFAFLLGSRRNIYVAWASIVMKTHLPFQVPPCRAGLFWQRRRLTGGLLFIIDSFPFITLKCLLTF